MAICKNLVNVGRMNDWLYYHGEEAYVGFVRWMLNLDDDVEIDEDKACDIGMDYAVRNGDLFKGYVSDHFGDEINEWWEENYERDAG